MADPCIETLDLVKPGMKTVLVMMVQRLDRPLDLDDWRNMASMLEAQADVIREAVGK
jgi:hypothetical protein